MPDDKAFSLPKAQMVSLFVQSIAFGMYLISCVSCAEVLLRIGETPHRRWRRRGELRWVTISAGIALLVTASLNMSLGFYRNLLAFTGPGGPEKALADTNSWINVVKVRCTNCLLISFKLTKPSTLLRLRQSFCRLPLETLW
jgi:hypothetical protein